MTYKEACEAIDKLCEDWKTRCGNYKLESVGCKLSSKKSAEKIQDLTRNIFDKTTNGALSVEVELSDIKTYMFHITLCSRSGCKCEGFSCPWAGIPVGQLTKERFMHTFFQDVQHVLGRALTSNCIEDPSELSEVTRKIALAELAMEQDNFFATVQAEVTERGEEWERFDMSRREYSNWKIAVERAMLDATAAWIGEVPLVPGMKIATKGITAQYYPVKTLKALSEEGSIVLLDFTDGSRIPRVSSRFYEEGTWLVNNDRYREIAVALDFPEAKKLRF